MSKIMRLIKFIADLAKKRNFPAVVNYDITSKCNLNCEHCYWQKTYNSKKELSDKEWEKIFIDHRNKGAEFAFLTGGEPMLRINVIRKAAKIFPAISIVSNGVIKVPEDIQTRIFISIDGPKKIHNKIRRVDVFDKIMKNIKNDKRVLLTPTLSTTNYKYIEDLVDIAIKSNVDGIMFNTYTSHQQSGDPLVLKGDKLDYVCKKLKELLKKHKDIMVISEPMINLFKTKKHKKACYFRGKYFRAFDANINPKSPCTLGEGVNCDTCGCIVPIFGYAASHGDLRGLILLDKLFPARYYDK